MASHCIWSSDNCLCFGSFVNVTTSIFGMCFNNPNNLGTYNY